LSEIILKSGEVQDIEKCLEIYFNEPFFHQYGLTKVGMEKLFYECHTDKNQKFLIASDKNDRIIGFALFDTKGAFSRCGYLRLIVVDSDARNMRVGESLMTFLENENQNSNGFCLLVTSTNLKAQKFYEKLGFEKIGELKNYVRMGLNEFIYFKKKK
jgi:ribosomal protein S18 acetylase RimI-like enzyme